MRIDIPIPAADYRAATPFVFEWVPGQYKRGAIRRTLMNISANLANVDVGIYIAPSGLLAATLTTAIRAAGLVYVDAVVVPVAPPLPELNVIGTPIPIEFLAGESLYFRMSAGGADAAVTGTVSLFL